VLADVLYVAAGKLGLVRGLGAAPTHSREPVAEPQPIA
jgi:hypothetical protein